MEAMRVSLLDLGDTYISVYNDGAMKVAIEWYEALGFNGIEQHDTGLVLSIAEKQALEQVFGRMMDIPNHGSPQQFLNDFIEAGAALSKFVRAWKPADNTIIQRSMYDDMIHVNFDKAYFVVYNTYFKLCTVIHEHYLYVTDMVFRYPDFEIIGAVKSSTDECMTILNLFFKQKGFAEKQDVITKYSAFLTMYPEAELRDASILSLTKPHGSAPDKPGVPDKFKYANVQEFVKRFIEWNYNITKSMEQDHRIKVTELNAELSTALCTEFINSTTFTYPRTSIQDKEHLSLFKRHCALCLNELGIIKKRYTDGFYYCGLIPKFNEKITASPEELAKQRDTDTLAKPHRAKQPSVIVEIPPKSIEDLIKERNDDLLASSGMFSSLDVSSESLRTRCLLCHSSLVTSQLLQSIAE